MTFMKIFSGFYSEIAPTDSSRPITESDHFNNRTGKTIDLAI